MWYEEENTKPDCLYQHRQDANGSDSERRQVDELRGFRINR